MNWIAESSSAPDIKDVTGDFMSLNPIGSMHLKYVWLDQSIVPLFLYLKLKFITCPGLPAFS